MNLRITLLACLLAGIGVAIAVVGDRSLSARAVGIETASTWQMAEVAIPAGVFAARPLLGTAEDPALAAALGSDTADPLVPAVIFMHGCSGIGDEERSLKLILMEAGYATFLPNSFARTGRVSNCVPSSKEIGLSPEALSYRLEEIGYAIEQVRALNWIDAERVFAIGFSEGAMAVASYPANDLAGLVVLAWHCHGRPPFDGIKAAPSVPVLAIIGEDDPWYRAMDGKHCGEWFGPDRRGQSLVLQGNSHALINSPIVENAERAKGAILEFLGAH